MRKRKLKHALISSIMSLTLCSAMLVGTTFAWMTDSVTSKENRIVAGNARIALMTYEDNEDGTRSYTDISGMTGDLFRSETDGNGTFWEPGTERSVKLAVKNEGSLTLKYEIGLMIRDAGLAELLDYSIVHIDDIEEELALMTAADDEQESAGPGAAANAADNTAETDILSDFMDWYPIAESISDDEEMDGPEERNSGVSYIAVSEERIIAVPDADEPAMAAASDEAPASDPLTDHFVLTVRMKGIANQEEAEKYRNAQCEIDICILATQVIETESKDDIVAMPMTDVESYIYHLAFAEVDTVENGDDEEIYVTTEPITASSSNAAVAIELPEGTRLESENGVIVSVSPKKLAMTEETETAEKERTVQVQLYGISEENDVPFTLTQDIGPENQLAKILFPCENAMHSIMVDEEHGKAYDPENGETYEYDPEYGWLSAYDEQRGYGFAYAPENGLVTIWSIHQGDYTLVFENTEEIGSDADHTGE